jgi:2-oxo-4-hydroxy-4-carboxy-5-ureidoimidazoline decarboxylase
MTLSELNRASQPRFVDLVGWVFENSPWVAERAWEHRPFLSHSDLFARMTDAVEAATKDEKIALLRAHPDLGTRAKIGEASAAEQAAVGLDHLTPDEHATLTTLSAIYRARFGFPFLFAVKGATKLMILESLAKRVTASPETEFAEALRQVGRIARFRLEDLISEG